MKSQPECEKKRRDTKIVLQENKSKIVFLNSECREVLVIRVDGCVIKDRAILRCDYALVPCAGIEVYVELKGSDTKHAVAQIESTLEQISENPTKMPKICFVVSTRVPRQDTNIQNLKVYFKKKFNGTLHIKSSQQEYDLQRVVP